MRIILAAAIVTLMLSAHISKNEQEVNTITIDLIPAIERMEENSIETE